MSSRLQVAPEVADALDRAVALETSVAAQGLPSPRNLEAARGAELAIRAEGAVPATVAVLDGRLRVGLKYSELVRVASGAAKASARDLGPLLASRAVGATTVAGTVRAAHLAGIKFMSTGGIGGVHRGGADDVSADLAELASTPVAVFCSGPKLVLDVRRTRERLESLSVPVIGYGCEEMPAFYTARSGCHVDARVDSPEQLCAVLQAAWETGARGVVVAVPPPKQLPHARTIVSEAAREVGGTGPAVTPRVLARVAELSEGRSLDVNVALLINNARVAGQCAAEWSRRGPRG